jgi:hypothetical protein
MTDNEKKRNLFSIKQIPTKTRIFIPYSECSLVFSTVAFFHQTAETIFIARGARPRRCACRSQPKALQRKNGIIAVFFVIF